MNALAVDVTAILPAGGSTSRNVPAGRTNRGKSKDTGRTGGSPRPLGHPAAPFTKYMAILLFEVVFEVVFVVFEVVFVVVDGA